MRPLAILNVADTQPAMDLVYMLESAGYTCAQPSKELLKWLRGFCVGVQDNDDLVREYGYERLTLPFAGAADMRRVGTLFVDTRGFRNYTELKGRWPDLHVMCYLINGGPPRRNDEHGDGIDPPCPVVTPNRWYNHYIKTTFDRPVWRESPKIVTSEKCSAPWCYVFWPPFARFESYYVMRNGRDSYSPPVCFCHNVAGWGHGPLLQEAQKFGVCLYGRNTTGGLLYHPLVREKLDSALAYVHLKGGDAMGYALMEAMAAACPVIVSRKYIADVKCGELLVEGETCLCFDDADRGGEERRGLHAEFSPKQVAECAEEIRRALALLKSGDVNRKIGTAGRAKLDSLRWRIGRDATSFRDFLRVNYANRYHR